MAYYKVVLKGGHMGAGKSYDMVRYYHSHNMCTAYSDALMLSRVKKNPHGTAIYSIEQVADDEYRKGKVREKQDPYLNYYHNPGKGCTYRK